MPIQITVVTDNRFIKSNYNLHNRHSASQMRSTITVNRNNVVTEMKELICFIYTVKERIKIIPYTVIHTNIVYGGLFYMDKHVFDQFQICIHQDEK